jgi:hypothetical protein
VGLCLCGLVVVVGGGGGGGQKYKFYGDDLNENDRFVRPKFRLEFIWLWMMSNSGPL